MKWPSPKAASLEAHDLDISFYLDERIGAVVFRVCGDDVRRMVHELACRLAGRLLRKVFAGLGLNILQM